MFCMSAQEELAALAWPPELLKVRGPSGHCALLLPLVALSDWIALMRRQAAAATYRQHPACALHWRGCIAIVGTTAGALLPRCCAPSPICLATTSLLL